jgi:hypothetical protein
MTHYSLLATYYAFLFSAISTFIVTLRTLINADWLIVIALRLFIVSVAGLLLGVGLAVVDLHTSRTPLWQEVGGMLNVSKALAVAKGSSRPRALRGTSKRLRGANPEVRPPARARVG